MSPILLQNKDVPTQDSFDVCRGYGDLTHAFLNIRVVQHVNRNSYRRTGNEQLNDLVIFDTHRPQWRVSFDTSKVLTPMSECTKLI